MPAHSLQKPPLMPTIFFDLDDTLFDYQQAKNAAVIAFSQLLPSRFTSHTAAIAQWDAVTLAFMAQYHRGALTYKQQQQKRVMAFFDRAMSESQAQQCYDQYQTLYEQHWHAFDDVLPVLTALKAEGFKLAIITDGPPQQMQKLERLGIAPFFEHMTIPQEVGNPKPTPKIFELAASKAQQPVSHCWYVGNHFEKDFVGALNAGFKSIWLNREGVTSTQQALALKNSHGRGWCVQSLQPVLSIIREHTGQSAN